MALARAWRTVDDHVAVEWRVIQHGCLRTRCAGIRRASFLFLCDNRRKLGISLDNSLEATWLGDIAREKKRADVALLCMLNFPYSLCSCIV